MYKMGSISEGQTSEVNERESLNKKELTFSHNDITKQLYSTEWNNGLMIGYMHKRSKVRYHEIIRHIENIVDVKNFVLCKIIENLAFSNIMFLWT